MDTNNDLVSLFLIFGLIPLIALTIFILVQRTRHKERMAMIENGLGESLLNKKESPFQDILMWGMLSTGLGIGLLVGYILLNFYSFKDDMILGIMSMLFGGLGLITYFFYKKRSKKGLE
jgi:preprotein translocase subunit SecG